MILSTLRTSICVFIEHAVNEIFYVITLWLSSWFHLNYKIITLIILLYNNGTLLNLTAMTSKTSFQINAKTTKKTIQISQFTVFDDRQSLCDLTFLMTEERKNNFPDIQLLIFTKQRLYRNSFIFRAHWQAISCQCLLEICFI